MNRTARNVLLVLLGLGILALAIFLVLPPSLPLTVPLPNPNGYDVIVKAGRMIQDDFSDLGKLSHQELQAAVLTNVEALKMARTGLTLNCRVPPMDSAAVAAGGQLNDLSKLKRLAQVFAAEGKLAESENRVGDAAAAYLDVIRLGHELCRGGVLINALVGIAVEAIGTAHLEKLASNLDAKTCRQGASTMEDAEALRESVDTVLHQERAWARRNYGLKGVIVRLFTIKSLRRTEQSFAARSKAQQSRASSLMVRLAARAYDLEHGTRPQNITDLVPAYLKAIPLDPATGTNMLYLP